MSKPRYGWWPYVIDCSPWMVQGTKEAISMDLEKYGEVKVIEVTEYAPEQLKMGGGHNGD